jgi:3-hydroxy acid dehydrogenase / malonic semialdehyde reductase
LLADDKLKLLKYELLANTECHFIACDVADKERIFEEITNLPVEFAKIDVLINCAGLALGLEAAHETEWQD